MDCEGGSLHRKVLEKNLQNCGVGVTAGARDTNGSGFGTLNSSVTSTLSREHVYMWDALKIWEKDPEPERLLDIKYWKKWIQQVARKRAERERFYAEDFLTSQAKLLLEFLLDDKLKFLRWVLKRLDNDQSSRLKQCIAMHEERECAELAFLANSSGDSVCQSVDEEDEITEVTPSPPDGVELEARIFPLKPSNVYSTSPQSSRESSSQSGSGIFKNLYSNGYSSYSSSSTTALSRNRNKRSNSGNAGACKPADAALRKRHRSGEANQHPYNPLNIRVVPGKPRNSVERSNRPVAYYSPTHKQNVPVVNCIQDEVKADRPECTGMVVGNVNSQHDIFEHSMDYRNGEDVVIENPTPPCSPPTLSARGGESEVSRRKSYSGSIKPVSKSPSPSTTPRRGSFSSAQTPRRASESKLVDRERKVKGIRPQSTKEPLTRSVVNQTTIDDNCEPPDLELPDIDVTTDQDKENYPVSSDEIDEKYPKPPSAPALTLEMFEELKKALDKPPKEKIVTGFSLYILQEDLAVFSKDTEWLNDRNIDFYLELIKDRSNRTGYPKVYIFHSFFYTLLTDKDGGYEVVQETTGEDDIFKYDIVLFPVNLNQHWRLVVVKFSEKSLKCYDSMKHDNADVLKSLGKYLKKEYHRKYRGTNGENEKLNGYASEDDRFSSILSINNGESVPTRMFFDSSTWTVENVASETIPQQKNAIDCGVFVLQYAEYLSRGKDFDFDQSHIPYFRKRMMYETLTKQLLTSAAPPGNENLGKP